MFGGTADEVLSLVQESLGIVTVMVERMPPGGHLCGHALHAVRIPGRLIFALALTGDLEEVDAFLDDTLKGGPVICDPHGRRYYALVPASMACTWHQAAGEWHAKADVAVLGRGTYLGVPRVDLTEFDPQGCVSFWSVPMKSAARLCAPLAVARLIAAGQHATTDESQ